MGVITGEGTTLSYGKGETPTFTEAAQVLSVNAPGWERPAVSTKHLKSEAATKRPGKIPDYGQVSFRIAYDPRDTKHAALEAMATDLDMYTWKVEYFDEKGDAAGSHTFPGFLSEFQPGDLEDEANAEADITIEVNGKPVFTAAGGGT